MKLHVYVVKHDTGFAPNPFWGHCTLACCKPIIRRTAREGDWIVGLSSKAAGNGVIYAMQVEEVVSFDQYYRDKRFAHKIPEFTKGAVIFKCGDNIYQPVEPVGFVQLQSMHSNGPEENLQNKKHDLGGENVLISRRFCYFGSKPVPLPPELADLKVGRGHKNRFPPATLVAFEEFIDKQTEGVHAAPSRWPQHDESWKEHRE